ncbi:hypothetical protein Q3G72_031969 [Acer saccharum]|nr:hypothetical protein Q3G72_031969 [Acer saccharum]
MRLKNGFLVDVVNDKDGTTIKLDSISTGSQWLGTDVLLFNTCHWWTHTGRYRSYVPFNFKTGLLSSGKQESERDGSNGSSEDCINHLD